MRIGDIDSCLSQYLVKNRAIVIIDDQFFCVVDGKIGNKLTVGIKE